MLQTDAVRAEYGEHTRAIRTRHGRCRQQSGPDRHRIDGIDPAEQIKDDNTRDEAGQYHA